MRWTRRGLKLVLLAVVALGVVGLVVMSLWNWLLPTLFGWPALGFWQALGLLALCRILFGSLLAQPGRRGHWRRRMIERWERMTPEERERFKAGMRVRCGGFGHAPAEPKA